MIDASKDKYPFLTGVKYMNDEFVGILQNHTRQITTFYDFQKLRNETERKWYLEAGRTWWQESNRIIPINFFMGSVMDDFRHTLVHLNSKYVEFVLGPVISVENIQKKRTKRRTHRVITPRQRESIA